ncbi:hypothetical protein BGS_1057 [Beggiatoa sp. SS]|nr:hypothetical protein BGS_1057 [Beggiatoa sp. SS]
MREGDSFVPKRELILPFCTQKILRYFAGDPYYIWLS